LTRNLLPILLFCVCQGIAGQARNDNAGVSPYIHKVYEYLPAPGQFVNELPEYETGDNAREMALKAEESIEGDEKILVSLGGYGGYVIFGFDHPVVNVAGKYDFKILANAFYANANPNPDAPGEGGSCEPGIVMVSYDTNGNGKPDDEWYELAGSEYYKPETIHNYKITYYKPTVGKTPTPDRDYPFLNDTTYIKWKDNQGKSGYISRNVYHDQPYWPEWITADSLVFEGTKLADNYIDESGTGSYYVQYAYAWGYVDNHPNSDERSNFNIEWAVDKNGNSVHLPAVHFIKVYTGVNQYCGWLGETSTEIMGAEDLHPNATIPVNPKPGDIITLDLNKPTNPATIELNTQGYWTETYSNHFPALEFGLFSFTHLINGGGGTDVGGGMSYWDGFTYCTNGDTEDYGASGSSDGWVNNQWGCMAGEKGVPYLVAYWGYWIEEMENGAPCLRTTFTDKGSYEAVGVSIANHPWPYYGNIHGDGFARPFDEGDSFKLYIHGVNEVGEDVGNPVEHTLAKYENGELIQSPDWEWVDLSSLGTVSGFFFTMHTSDANLIYGPNTAVYFCLDKLQVRVPNNGENAPPSRPTNLKTVPTETTIALTWNPSSDDVEVAGYHVYLNNERVATVQATAYLFENLAIATSYQLSVAAFDNEGVVSDKANIDASTTDETPPTMPAHLEGIPTATTIALTWEASTDNVGVIGYNVYLNGQREKKVTTTTYTLALLDSATTYLIEVEAVDAAGNKSEKATLSLSTSSETDIPMINAEDDTIVAIYNVTGQKMATTDISHLPQGVYIIKYKLKTIKIIK
jgi:chitodextrinase